MTAGTYGDLWKSLALRPREISILNAAITSRVKFGADFLPAQDKGSQNAARRLIEKGYLTKGKAKLTPSNGWIVVCFTEKNRKKMLADAESKQ